MRAGGAAALALVVAVGCGGDPLRIDDRQISYSEFERYLEANSIELEFALEGAASSRLFDQFLDEELLRQLARDRGLVTADGDSAAALEALLDAAEIEPVSAAEIEAYHRARADAYRRPERVRLRQILVADADSAAAARAELDAGAAFEEVAARHSLGPAASRGGDQGVLARDDLPPAFVEPVFSLEEGRISEVVAADYGYHIFQVTRRWPAEIVSLEQAAPEIRELLAAERRRTARAELVEEARRRYNPRVDEKNLPFRYEGAFGGGA